ncbi:MAG: zf-HC2 domain-containing protein [Acidobacteriota bacterium]|nr:zf-HC2 domain-containing protein [Acidobacteriota bacterium]
MSCQNVQNSLSAFLDGEIDREERERVSVHLAQCRECNSYSQELHSVRAMVRELPVPRCPARLQTQLRVIASREKTRRSWRDRASLALRNIMRPLAVPATGGLTCAFLLFAILSDGIGYGGNLRNDIPSGLFTQVTVEDPSPFGCSGRDVVVQLTIDRHGNVSDYSVPAGKLSRDEMREMGNLILFTSFNPATAYGLPLSSKVMVSFRHINVRG